MSQTATMERFDIMEHPEITRVKGAIHNPDEARHYMKLKPVARTVRIKRGDLVLAETTCALRLLEVGFDLYDPVFYILVEDVIADLALVPEKSTHCPLKGDASYYATSAAEAKRGEFVGWAYSKPFDFASVLTGYVAFDASKVRIEELGDVTP